MMKRVLVLVEGQTENEFVKRILAPRLLDAQIALIPTVNTTKRVLSGANFKGGDVRYTKILKELKILLGDTNAAAITTLVDYYGFHLDIPDAPANPTAADIECMLSAELNHPRFIPHLQMHEFEALLFSAPDVAAAVLGKPAAKLALEKIVADCGSPEEVNNNPVTAPSRRLIGIFPEYNKRIDGVRVLEKIDLSVVRNQCPKFNRWLTAIEGL